MNTNSNSYTIRFGEKKDLPRLLELIQELATYEKAPDAVTNTLELLEEDGFGPKALYRFFVAENEHCEVIGIALFYPKYSTWKGRGLYLDDIVVTERYRRMGVGKLLFDAVVKTAQEEKARLLWWQVLDWNTPAIEFYKKYNAGIEGGWLNCVLQKDQLERM